MVEGARLESVYTPKVYRGFESRPLRNNVKRIIDRSPRRTLRLETKDLIQLRNSSHITRNQKPVIRN